MKLDLSKVAFSSGNNAFKNDGFIYTGSVDFPTSLTGGQLSSTTTTVALGELPQFSKFYAYFQEFLDATVGNSAQWYSDSVSGQWAVGIYVSAPVFDVGWINATVYPVILGDEIQITATVFNPYSDVITLTALNVPFAFVEYTLAN